MVPHIKRRPAFGGGEGGGDSEKSSAPDTQTGNRVRTTLVLIGLVLAVAVILLVFVSGTAAASQGDQYESGENTPGEGEVWVLNDSDTVRENFTLTDGNHAGQLNVTRNGVDQQIDIQDQQNTSALVAHAASLGATAENDTLLVGPGTYNVSDHEAANPTADDDGNVTEMLSDPETEDPVFEAVSGTPYSLLSISNSGTDELTVRDIHFEGNKIAQTSVGISDISTDGNVDLSGVKINDTINNALEITDSGGPSDISALNVSNATIQHSGMGGIFVNHPTIDSVNVSNVTVQNNGFNGMQAKDSDVNISVAESVITENGGTGVDLNATNETTVTNNTITKNGGFGIQVHGSSDDNEFVNNTVTDNDGWDDGLDIRIGSDSTNNTFTKLNIGDSPEGASEETIVDLEARDATIAGVGSLPARSYGLDGAIESTNRSVDGQVQPGGYLNVTIHADEGADDLAMWNNPWLDHWEKVFEASVDEDANTVTYNVTTDPGEFASPTLGLFEDETATLSGTLQGDGARVNGEVFVTNRGGTYQRFENDLPGGDYQFALPEGTYSIFADAKGNASEFREDVIEVDAQETVTEDIDLNPSAVIEGTVKGGEQQGFVFVNDGDQFYTNETEDDGSFRLEVPEGTHNVIAINDTENELGVNESVSATTDQPTTGADVTISGAEVSNESVSIIEGNGDEDKIGVETDLMPPSFLAVALNNTDTAMNPIQMPNDLTGQGVDEDTRFEINFTVAGIEPDALLWNAKDVDWNAEDADGGTNITIEASPGHLAGVAPQNISGTQMAAGPLPPNENVRDIDWPTGQNDTAADGMNWENTVYLAMLDTVILPQEFQEQLEDVTTTTNGQLFSTPQVRDDRLRIYVAGPSERPDGTTHEGFYEAFIPDRLLSDWGVDDPEEGLNALVQGDPEDFSVTETDDGPNGVSGAWIEIENVGYSDGYIDIEADESDDSDPAPTGGGSTSSPSEADDKVTIPAEAAVAADSQPLLDADPEREGTQVAFKETERTEEIGFEDDELSPTNLVSVTESDTVPEGISDPAGDVRSVVQIDVSEEVQDRRATIRFRLSTDEIESEPESVVMEHYDEADGSWSLLETSVVESDGDTVRFESETPGFSVFAVTETDDESESEEDAEQDAESDSKSDAETETEPDAEQDTESDSKSGTETETEPEPEPEDQAGFGVVLTVLALLSVVALVEQRS